jgi:hypothetical protein
MPVQAGLPDGRTGAVGRRHTRAVPLSSPPLAITGLPSRSIPTAIALAALVRIFQRKHRGLDEGLGNEHLQSILVECAWAAVRHDGYLKSLYHRHVMKQGGYRSQTAKKKAIVVVAHALVTDGLDGKLARLQDQGTGGMAPFCNAAH